MLFKKEDKGQLLIVAKVEYNPTSQEILQVSTVKWGVFYAKNSKAEDQ